MLHFDFFMPTRIVFGPGRLDELALTAGLPAGTRAMIVIGAEGAMLQQGYLARVQGLLAARGVATLVYDRIRPNPESLQVNEGATKARAKKVDYIVGLENESLSAWGLETGRIEELAHTAIDTLPGLTTTTPVPMAPVDVERILAAAINH